MGSFVLDEREREREREKKRERESALCRMQRWSGTRRCLPDVPSLDVARTEQPRTEGGKKASQAMLYFALCPGRAGDLRGVGMQLGQPCVVK